MFQLQSRTVDDVHGGLSANRPQHLPQLLQNVFAHFPAQQLGQSSPYRWVLPGTGTIVQAVVQGNERIHSATTAADAGDDLRRVPRVRHRRFGSGVGTLSGIIARLSGSGESAWEEPLAGAAYRGRS